VRCSKSTTFFREFYTPTGYTDPLEINCERMNLKFLLPFVFLNQKCLIFDVTKVDKGIGLQTCSNHLSNYMKSSNFYLSFFSRRPLEMSLFFVYCGALACFVSSIGHY